METSFKIIKSNNRFIHNIQKQGKMTYNDRVKEIAEKMAKVAFEEHQKERGETKIVAFERLPLISQGQYDEIIEMHIPLAKIAVAEMAEIYRLALKRYTVISEKRIIEDLIQCALTPNI